VPMAEAPIRCPSAPSCCTSATVVKLADFEGSAEQYARARQVAYHAMADDITETAGRRGPIDML
jgi:hypothetical protein